jgi:hypothetical protein
MLSAADSLRVVGWGAARVVVVVAAVLAAPTEEGGKFGDCGICGRAPRAC